MRWREHSKPVTGNKTRIPGTTLQSSTGSDLNLSTIKASSLKRKKQAAAQSPKDGATGKESVTRQRRKPGKAAAAKGRSKGAEKAQRIAARKLKNQAKAETGNRSKVFNKAAAGEAKNSKSSANIAKNTSASHKNSSIWFTKSKDYYP